MKGIFLENSDWIGWLWVFHSIGLTVFSLIVLVNLFWVQSIGMCKNPLFFPLVSVLIPARNEEKNIGKLLTCLEQQDYPNFEVIVLDDHSTDGTESVVLPFLSRNRRWRMLSGRPLPPEWRGKPFACYQLGLEASGEILLFIDADTLPKSNALTATVCALEKYDFISVFPEQVVKTWSEKLIVPVMDFFLYSHLMFPLITKTSNPAFTAANGQWMAFKRLAYEAINGHLAAKSAILDDMTLAKAIKKAGFKMNTFSGINTIYCRMYQSFEEVITGFSKNSFAAANYNYWTFSIFLLQFMFWFLLPFCLINSIFIFSVGWILLLKFLIAWKFHHPKVETVLLHPVQILLAFGIAVNSMIWKFTGKGQWKGRNL